MASEAEIYAMLTETFHDIFMRDDIALTPTTTAKQVQGWNSFGQRMIGAFFTDVRDEGFAATVSDRLEWGKMRMTPTDIPDVSGATGHRGHR